MPRLRKKNRLDILNLAIPLFARLGYEGVSMRNLATRVGVTPAALYHHFKDKDELYIDAVSHAFEQKTADIQAVMAVEGGPMKRLEAFVGWFVRVLNKDQDFQKLLQRVMLDSNSQRMQKLTKATFQELFSAIQNLGESFKSKYDPHLLAISIIGLVLYHFETSSVRSLLPGSRAAHDKAETITQHVTSLLENGLLSH